MKILLADDHALLLQGLALTIKELFPQSDLHCNTSWQEVQQTLTSNLFDLVLLDIFMPSEQTWEHELARIIKRHPNLPVCMISSSSEPVHIETAFALGVKGYLCKTATVEEIKQALLTIIRGECYIPPQACPFPNFNKTLGLTFRQQEILKLMAQGKNIKVIARELQLSDNTVKTHIATIYQILKVNNRIEAINVARQRGLLGYY